MPSPYFKTVQEYDAMAFAFGRKMAQEHFATLGLDDLPLILSEVPDVQVTMLTPFYHEWIEYAMIRTLTAADAGAGDAHKRIGHLWRSYAHVRAHDNFDTSGLPEDFVDQFDHFLFYKRFDQEAWPHCLKRAEKDTAIRIIKEYHSSRLALVGDAGEEATKELQINVLHILELGVRAFALKLDLADPYATIRPMI